MKTFELTPEQQEEVLAVINQAKAEAEALIEPDEGKEPDVVAEAEAAAERLTALAALFAQ